jgi:hypothetical protein
MASDKKIAANRENAKMSTGPRTRSGKARVSLNAVKHGIYAAPELLPGESKSELRELTSSIVDTFNPQGPIQWLYVSEIVGDMVRLKRMNLAEYAYLRNLFRDAREEIPDACEKWNLSVAMGMSVVDGAPHFQPRRRMLLSDIWEKIKALQILKENEAPNVQSLSNEGDVHKVALPSLTELNLALERQRLLRNISQFEKTKPKKDLKTMT